MKRRAVVVNFVILVGIIVFAMRFISAWEGFREQHNLVTIVSGAPSNGADTRQPSVEPMAGAQPFSDFIVISERNLFREDRRPPAVVVEAEEEEAPQAKPPKWSSRPVLHGVSTLAGRRQAIMTVFSSSNAKESQMKSVEVGTSVQGYEVSEIQDTLVKLQWKDRVEVINMSDSQGSAAGGGAKKTTASVTVVKVGAALEAIKTVGTKENAQTQGQAVEVAVVSRPSASGGSAAARESEQNRSQPRRPARNSPRR